MTHARQQSLRLQNLQRERRVYRLYSPNRRPNRLSPQQQNCSNLALEPTNHKSLT